MKKENAILSGRNTGKTTEMIVRSHMENVPIVTFNSKEAERIEKMAKDLGFSIPQPVTFQNLSDPWHTGLWTTREILVDELIAGFQNHFGVKVVGFTASVEE